ncbi:MAG: DUF2721 domain-containing protein [Chitinispirillaceae bacterium]|nr:DUF2721 domain-containing protein [Chitinispirillaceae bacterium]
MEFGLTTPSLLFSAISLLFLAYTNRFMTIANLIRQFIAIYKKNPDKNLLYQIKNFYLRLKIIKYTQVFGVLSFIFCVASMFLIFVKKIIIAEIVFGISLLLLLTSLILSLYEILLSIDALKVELKKVDE